MRLGVARGLVDGEWVEGDVEVRDGCVAAVGVGAPGGSRIAVPGLVDLQVNGFAGVDFSAPGEGGWTRAAEALLASGVTAFQPTLVTAPVEEMVESLAAIEEVERGPCLIGVHLEGPFISPARPGAHDPAAILAPDPALLGRLLGEGPGARAASGPAPPGTEPSAPAVPGRAAPGEAPSHETASGRAAPGEGPSAPAASGPAAPGDARSLVSQMTLAPEMPGALDLVDALVARGVVVSLGHTDADAAAAHAAFDRGARAVTHLFNAMRRPEPRDPGVAFAALGRDEVFVTAIVDGHHLAADTVLAAWRAAGGRFVLISDAVAAAGAPDGEHTLGGRVRVRSEGGTVRTASGSLAGSTLTMLDAVRNLHALGVPLAAALAAATVAPTRMCRRPDLGRLNPGAPTDLLVLDDSLTLDRVLLGGELAGSENRP